MRGVFLRACLSLYFCCGFGLATNTPSPASAVQAASEAKNEVSLRIRISLGGGAARKWAGRVSIRDNAGTLTNLTPLGLSENANASIVLRDNAVSIDHQRDVDYNAVDIDVRASAKAELLIELAPNSATDERFEQTLKLQNLLQGKYNRDLDSQGNRISIARVPGDSLRFEINREHLVFAPDEPIRFSIVPNQTGLIDQQVNCLFEVAPARRPTGSVVLWRQYTSFATDAAGSAEPQSMTIPAPSKEGVYEIAIELQPSRLPVSNTSEQVLRRKVQFVVLAPTAPDRSADENWKVLQAFSPAELLAKEQASWPRQLKASFNKRSTHSDALGDAKFPGNNRRQLVTVADKSMLQIDAGGWQAIPISCDKTQGPCLIEVDYVADGELALGVSLLKPDEAGQVSPLGQDSGPFVPQQIVPANVDSKPVLQTHRLYHWPNDSATWLVIANRHDSQAGTIAEVRVLAGPDRLPLSNRERASAGAIDRAGKPRRSMMAFFEAPLFPDNFGSSEHVDPVVGQPLDDWLTFYQGADRLVQYLKAHQMAGAFMAVACDGSGIYPSEFLRPGPRYDNGVFFSNGQDPLRKDVVELLFRMFERESLKLVPVLALTGPISELETSLERAGETPPYLVDFNGAIVPAGSVSTLPRYNPLDPRVQSAVQQVIADLARRYRQYRAFDGIAIACRPDTCTLLPGQQWACDDATVDRFLTTAEGSDVEQLRGLDTPEQLAALLGPLRDRWLRWRAAEMASGYRRLRDAMRQSLPDGKLYLAPIDLYRNPEIAAALSPGLHASNRFSDVMLRLGFDSSLLGASTENQDIVLLNPHRIASGQPLASRRVDVEVENSGQAADFFRQSSTPGDLFVHRNSWVHFAQLQEQPAFARQATALMRLQQLTPAGQTNRRRFVERIRDTDSQLLIDGGWMIPTGQEQALSELKTVFAQLPAVSFKDVPNELNAEGDRSAETEKPSSPVIVRQQTVDGQSWFYAVNASPWKIKLKCTVENPMSNTGGFESLSSNDIRVAENGLTIELTLEPWTLAGGRSATSHSQLTSYSVQFPDDADIHLRKEIYRLQSFLAQAVEVKSIDGLSNPNFENVTTTLDATGTAVPMDREVAGWSHGPGDLMGLQLVSSQTHEGQYALQVSNRQDSDNGRAVAPVWIRSNEFAAPETGRLSISAWLRTDRPDEPLPLRISLEGRVGQSSYYRFGSIGSLSPDPEANQVDSQWRRFAVHFDDLPLENLDRLRIGFDLMGAGSVAIDQVEVFDRWFDENDSKAITQLLASAATLLSSPATYDRCRRLLESYWPRFLAEHAVPVPTEAVETTPAESTPIRESRAAPDSSPEQPIVSPGRRFRSVFGPVRLPLR